MKRFIFLIAVILSILAACSKDEEPVLILSHTSIDAPANGCGAVMTLTANNPWSVSAAEWCTVTPSHGEGTGEQTISVTVKGNTTYDARNCTVSFISGELVRTIDVNQESNFGIVLPKGTYEVSSDAQKITVEVKANVEYEVTTDAEWITLSDTKALISNTFTFDIEKNTSYDAREGAIIIKEKNGPDKETIKVKQVQMDAILISSNEYHIPSQAQILEVKLQTNVGLEIVIPDNAGDWVSHTATKALSDKTLILDIKANEGYDARSCEVIVRKQNGTLSDTIKIVQAQKDAIIISQKEYDLSCGSHSLEIKLQTNVELDVVLPDNSRSWITYVQTKALADRTIVLDIKENDTYSDRESVVYIKDRATSLQDTVIIRQKQNDAVFLDRWEYVFDSNGGYADVEVRTNVDLNVSIPDSCSAWIGQVETKSLETKVLKFYVQKNETGRDRKGVVTISGAGISEEIQFVQYSREVEITDPVFRQYCLDNFDTDKDGKLTSEEAGRVVEIKLLTEEAESLSGIEFFANLTHLTVHPNSLDCTFMGIGDNTGSSGDTGGWRDSGYRRDGKRISGKLKELDLSRNRQLEYLDCSGNMIGALDLSSNDKLTYIKASANLDLAVLKLPKQVQTLLLSATSIEEVDLSGQHELFQLSVDRGIGLKALDVSGNPKLELLDIAKNRMTSVDVSKNPNLRFLDIGISEIDRIDVSNNVNLERLYINFTRVSDVDLSQNGRLVALYAHNSGVSELDLSGLPALENVHFGNYTTNPFYSRNAVRNIDLSGNPKLKWLQATILDLEDLDLTKNTQLEFVDICYNSLLDTLDISNSLGLQQFYSYGSPNLKTVYISPDQKFSYSADAHTSFAYKGTMYASTDYSRDGEVVVLQSATKGRGIDIVLMGDGFSDRLIADGTYDSYMGQAMEHFFSVEPYKSFRDYFNVYSVKAVSENETVSPFSTTALQCWFGDGTLVGGNDGTVFSYMQRAISPDRVAEATSLVVINKNVYAGTCYMYFPSSGNYGNGTSIAYVPLGNREGMFEELIHHEMGGHGFAKLGDEYYDESYQIGTEVIPESEVAIYKSRQASYGWIRNVDFTSDPLQVGWAKYISDSRYINDGLGVFEGGLTYKVGVWRPTEHSIMRFNKGVYNAPSREAIYNRIHKLAYGADWQYDHEAFVAYDAVSRGSAAVAASYSGAPSDFIPLHAPVVVKKRWQDVGSSGISRAGKAGENLKEVKAKVKPSGNLSMDVFLSGMKKR